MKAKVLEPSPSRRTLEVEVSPEEVAREMDRVTKQYARSLTLPGFRKGRTPPSMVRKRFQKEIETEVVEHLTTECSRKLIEEHKLAPLRPPVVEDYRLSQGGPLTFRTALEVRPPIDLGNYRGLEAVRNLPTVGDEMVERNLEALRKQGARHEAVGGRPLRDGDVAVVDMQRLGDDDEPMEDPRQGVALDLAEGGFPEEFRAQLRGMEVSESRLVTAEAPEGEAAPDAEGVAGARRYRIKLTAIREVMLPDLDDDFAKDLGNFDSLVALRQRLEQDLKDRADRQADDEVREQLVRRLVETHPLDAPESLVKHQLDRMLEQLAEAMARGGVDPTTADFDWAAKREELRESAVRRTSADLILDEIGRAEGLEVADEEILEALSATATQTKTSPAALRARLSKEGRLESLKMKMLREKSLDLVVGSANIMTKGTGP